MKLGYIYGTFVSFVYFFTCIKVTELPTIVAIRGGIPYATFTLPAEFTKDSEIDWQQLKAWIESVADKPI